MHKEKKQQEKRDKPVEKKNNSSNEMYYSRGSYESDLDPFQVISYVVNSLTFIFYLSLLINLIYVAITLTVIYINPEVERKQPKETVMEYEYEETDADRQERDFGPWVNHYDLEQSIVENKNFLNFALVEEIGEIKFSRKYKVVFEGSGFEAKNHSFIFSPQLLGSGQISFKDHNGNIHKLNPYQAFQFLDDIYITFMFNEKGDLYQAKTKNVKLQELTKTHYKKEY